jgi:hypothetical protein
MLKVGDVVVVSEPGINISSYISYKNNYSGKNVVTSIGTCNPCSLYEKVCPGFIGINGGVDRCHGYGHWYAFRRQGRFEEHRKKLLTSMV